MIASADDPSHPKYGWIMMSLGLPGPRKLITIQLPQVV